MNNNSNHKNGRPSKTGQLEIQRVLRPYFEQGISASLASEKTGINIKTICKYFDFWTQEISEAESSEFLERQKNERLRTIISLDKQIVEAHQLLDDVNEEIKKLNEQGKTIPRQLFSFKLEIMKYITNLTEKKGSFAMQPTLEEALEKKFNEMMDKRVKTRSDS